MNIVFLKSFKKEFILLSPNQKNRVHHALHLFQQDPFDQQLRNHALKGRQKEFRSISAGGDLRLIFEEIENYTQVIFYRVGTHNQVYK